MRKLFEKLVSVLLRAQGRSKAELADSWAAYLVTANSATQVETLALLDRHILSYTLRDVLSAGNVECILDVGAFTGDFFKFVRKIGFGGTVICFEPVAANLEALERCLGNDPAAEIQRLAVGSRDGSTVMHVSRHRNFSSTLELAENAVALFPEISAVVERQEVSNISLNSFLSQRESEIDPRCTFLKIDVQGAEFEVLQGAGNYLSSLAGLLIEIAVEPLYRGAPHYLEMLQFTHDAGFDPVGFYPVTRLSGGRTVEFDCLMVNRRDSSSKNSSTQTKPVAAPI